MLSKAEIFKKVEAGKLQADEAYKMIMESENGDGGVSRDPDSHALLESIRKKLINAVAGILKYNKNSISADSDFREFGFNSFSLVGFKKYIDNEYNVDLRIDAFYENSTINRLSGYLLDTYGDSIKQKYSKGIEEQEITGQIPPEEDLKNECAAGDHVARRINPKSIRLENQPLWLLNLSKKFPAELLENFWADLRENRIGEIQSEKVSARLLGLLAESGYRYMHMLVELYTGNKMEVFSAGKGEPIVVISGIGATATLAYNQLKNFSSKYRFIVFHVPGSGLSEGIEDLSLDNLAKVVLETMEKMGIKSPVHIFGGSWGAMVAMTYAKNYPDKTASMILMSPVVDLLDGAGQDKESSAEHLVHVNEIARADITSVAGGEKHYDLYSKSICADVITLSNYMRYFSSDSPNFYSTVDFLEDIEAPALIVTGSQDIMAGKRHSEILCSKLKNVRCFEIQGAGHFPALTHSKEFSNILSRFFSELGKEI